MIRNSVSYIWWHAKMLLWFNVDVCIAFINNFVLLLLAYQWMGYLMFEDYVVGTFHNTTLKKEG